MAKQQSTSSNAYTAFIDQGATFEGTLVFDGTVRIDGNFNGTIERGESLVLGEQAKIVGTIHVKEAIISGAFSGEILANTRIVITSSATVEGTLRAPSVGIEEGASFNGTISMGTVDAIKAKNDGDTLIESIGAQISQ